jgi:four helix bundle protein
MELKAIGCLTNGQNPKNMAKIERFEDLTCWQQARQLVNAAFSIDGPLNKDWDLRSQFRRAALSVMNNIAEGFGRFSQKEFIRFLEISQSSAMECKSMIYVMEDLGYLSKEKAQEFHDLFDQNRKTILGLIRYLKSYTKN